jgi:hypothetical protein
MSFNKKPTFKWVFLYNIFYFGAIDLNLLRK